MPLSNRRSIVHSIERGNLIDSHWRHLQYPRNLVHDTQARKSMLPLTQIQNWHNSGFLVLWGVSLEDLVDELVVLLRELEGDIRIVFRRVSVLAQSVSMSTVLEDQLKELKAPGQVDLRLEGHHWPPLNWP